MVMGIILVYACILMMHHLGEPLIISRLIGVSSTVFTVVFAIELLLKTMAYGFVKMLRRSPADMYDCAVVGVALVAMFLDLLYGISFGALASTARVTRVLLVFKIIRGAQALQEVRPLVGCYATSEGLVDANSSAYSKTLYGKFWGAELAKRRDTRTLLHKRVHWVGRRCVLRSMNG